MVNFNGKLLQDNVDFLNANNRAVQYGDGLFETIRVVHGKIFFWEEHYFRLMSSMRILRMEIPMDFTMEFLESSILETIESSGLTERPAKAKLLVFRKPGGLYRPAQNEIDYVITVGGLESPFYTLSEEAYEVELFKDYYLNADMLSNLKTTNKILNVVASVFAKENGYHNCLLLNAKKQVVETTNGNLFLVKGKTVKTPPLSDGCLNGIVRKELLAILESSEGMEVMVDSISPFELQKADELFVTNTISGIIPITKYRKKTFGAQTSKNLIGKLNARARLG